MSDLENFVNQSGRDKLVKDVRKKINDLGITYIYYQFVSVTGRIVGKGVPADHWESLAEKGFQLVYGATANLFVDRHGDYIVYGPESYELVGSKDFKPVLSASKVFGVYHFLTSILQDQESCLRVDRGLRVI